MHKSIRRPQGKYIYGFALTVIGVSVAFAQPARLEIRHFKDIQPLEQTETGCQTAGYPELPTHSKEESLQTNVVTVEQLHHAVPGKARREMEKAEKARAEKKLDTAADHYHRAIAIDPAFVAARNNLAAMLLKDRPEAAAAQLEEAVKADPHNPILFENLVLAYSRTGQLDAAERAARTAVDMDRTGSQLARVLLAVALTAHGKFTDEALESLERARGQYRLACVIAARVLIGQGRLEEARSELNTYLCGRNPEYAGIAKEWLAYIDRNEPKIRLALGQAGQHE